MQTPAAPFSAAVVPTKPSPLRLGEVIAFSLSTTVAGYGHLYLLNASGKVVALTENLSVAPVASVRFPAPHARFTLRASPPVGPNRVLFLVTSQPFPGFGGGGASNAPAPLTMQADSFVAQLLWSPHRPLVLLGRIHTIPSTTGKDGFAFWCLRRRGEKFGLKPPEGGRNPGERP